MSKADWVVAGGAPGEWSYCGRCGEGLSIGGKQRVGVALAAMKAFVRIHEKCRDTGHKEERITPWNWPHSRDVGVSSATIYKVLNGLDIYGEYGVPRDPSDFGRCYRLLKLIPEWEARLQEVADAYPAWVPFVREWPRLKAMWEEALRTDDGKAMYEFMQKLRLEGR